MGGRTVTFSGKVDLSSADRLFDWSGVHVVVAGLGTSGYAAADPLLELDATVLAVSCIRTASSRGLPPLAPMARRRPPR